MTDERDELTHETVEENSKEEMSWPLYYVCGEDVDIEDYVPAYYKVEGPNGPVSYVNPNYGPYPTTMFEFAMEAQSDDCRWCEREETPWPDYEEQGDDPTSD